MHSLYGNTTISAVINTDHRPLFRRYLQRLKARETRLPNPTNFIDQNLTRSNLRLRNRRRLDNKRKRQDLLIPGASPRQLPSTPEASPVYSVNSQYEEPEEISVVVPEMFLVQPFSTITYISCLA